MFQECLVYKKNKWVHHSTLNSPKSSSITIIMPNGIYVFGGKAFESDSGTTAEFLGNGEHQWKELDTNIPSPGLPSSDGVAISDEEIIFTGGMKVGMMLENSYRIRTFNVKTINFLEYYHIKMVIDKFIKKHRCGDSFNFQPCILNPLTFVS